MLEEIRRQEEILDQAGLEVPENEDDDDASFEPGVVEGDAGQTTLFGGDV